MKALMSSFYAVLGESAICPQGVFRSHFARALFGNYIVRFPIIIQKARIFLCIFCSRKHGVLCCQDFKKTASVVRAEQYTVFWGKVYETGVEVASVTINFFMSRTHSGTLIFNFDDGGGEGNCRATCLKSSEEGPWDGNVNKRWNREGKIRIYTSSNPPPSPGSVESERNPQCDIRRGGWKRVSSIISLPRGKSTAQSFLKTADCWPLGTAS